jgi:ectoine hydroxylase-related dioxygenase (phytanoyl-CoA dioxygenase family)
MDDTIVLSERYATDGYVVVRDALPPEQVAALSAAADALLAAAADRGPGDPHYDFEPDASGGRPVVQRIKRPHEIDERIAALARSPAILDRVDALIGPNIRLHHSKINVKAPQVGSPLEWHQDWAFIPHTNADLAIVAIAIDACEPDNGPMLMLPGSHGGGLRDHHHDGLFYGVIDPRAEALDLDAAVPVLGPVGTMSIHHPLTIHGSGFNRSRSARRLLFFEYAASDAWPLFYGVDWPEYESRMMRGRSTLVPRFGATPVRLPHPRPAPGMIYDLQRSFSNRYFR